MTLTLRKLMIWTFAYSVIACMPGTVSAAQDEVMAKPETGTITGKIMIIKGMPLSGGQVMFYSASSGVTMTSGRVPDVSGDIDADGVFRVSLKAGQYYLGAIKRMNAETIGPPKKGDYIFRSLDQKGVPLIYGVKAGETLNVGELSGAAPVKPEDLSREDQKTAISGTILTMDGSPAVDAIVVAFSTPTLKGKPLFVSDKTDKDGKYLLRVVPGTYYLRARNNYSSGPPGPGQIVGYFGEGTPVSITVKKDEIVKGADFRVVLFPGRGPFSGAGPEEPVGK